MMLRESFGLEIEAQWIETAIDRALDHGYRTVRYCRTGREARCAVRSLPSRFAANCTMCWCTTSATAGACSFASAELLDFLQHQAARNHVVERLPLLCKTRHDVADEKRDESGDDFREEPPGGAGEAYSAAFRSVTNRPSAIFPSVPWRAEDSIKAK